MPHFVYMLRCAGNRIYTGYAVNVEARYKQHVEGKGAKFTKAFPPECILHTFEFESKEFALRMEARIKKLPRADKERLATGDEVLKNSLIGSLDETLEEKACRERRKRQSQQRDSKIEKR